MNVTLRFVTCSDFVSRMIRDAEDFWASHVEAVTALAQPGYLGAHANGGVLVRPIGYDKATLVREEFKQIPCDDATQLAFETFLLNHVGQPYDFDAILGFVLRGDCHRKEHAICSALLVDALQSVGLLPKISIPSWEISPRDLHIMLESKYRG